MACRSFPVVLLLSCILMMVVVTQIYIYVKIRRSVHIKIQFYSRLTLRIRMEMGTTSHLCTKIVDITAVEPREGSGDPHAKGWERGFCWEQMLSILYRCKVWCWASTMFFHPKKRKGVLPWKVVGFLFLETFKQRMETLAQELVKVIPEENVMFS